MGTEGNAGLRNLLGPGANEVPTRDESGTIK